MCLAVLLSIWISLTKFKALSIQVNSSNSTCLPLTLTFHGPIKSMVTSSHSVQSSLLVWVGDHDYGLLIYIFWKSLYFSSLFWYQSLGWWWHWFNVSRNFFLARMSHHLVEPFDSMNYLWFGQPNFSNWVEQDLSYNRWCHQCCHLVVSWPSCLNYLLAEQAAVCPAAAIHKCEHNSMDFWFECEVSGKLR